jgi:hypothetical protein
VTITGSGFTPNSSIGVSMGDDPFVDGDSLDFSTAKIVTSDGSGSFTMTYNVVDTINRHTCVPSGCLIGAANLHVDNEFANRVSLSFGSSGSTSTTTPGSPSTTLASGTSGGTASGGSATGTTNGNGALASTGASDKLQYLAVGGFILIMVGATIALAAGGGPVHRDSRRTGEPLELDPAQT